MSAESPRHARAGGPLTVPSQPPSDRGLIDAVSGFINDVTLSPSTLDPKDVIQWARFETADINEPTPEGDSDSDISPLILILGYGSGVQVWLVPPSGEAQEVLSWRQGTVRVLRILPTPQHGDCFMSKRPLIALCDSASPGPTFCSLSFISIRGGEQVKSIKFKNPILDVLANKRSIVVAFSERFAVFDAGTLEDRIAITTCYPCPCPLGGSQPINPLALGDRWLAYADKKLHPSKRSSGGCEGEGVTSYTATVLHAAKSLSKGLRGLGESVAHSLAGGRSTSQSPSPPNSDSQQPGVVTILDIEGNEYDEGQDNEEPYDPIVAHFLAHSEAIIALKFDASGMLLVTADRRGHDFHVFRINPHPCGPSLASVHHLYILHRGDTTAKVQDIALSPDSRWAAITTLRGTTHVFAISPYGGLCGVRTHTQPRVVNRLSRFHRSAGLPIHAANPPRSGSPVGDGLSQGAWYPNPRLPPYPLPTTVSPLAQLRPTANLPTHTITRTSSGRQRLSSLSEDCGSAPLPARARFGSCGLGTATSRAPVHPALYLCTHTGCLMRLNLHARPSRSVPKEKICDESPIEVEVEPVAQWALQRPPPPAPDLLAPLPPTSPLLQPPSKPSCADMCVSEEERWLSQVEIVTHAGPHRRLWMGPQFVFKTYNSTGSTSSLSEAEFIEVDTSACAGVARSNPVNMPARTALPVLIDEGSASSLEHSPSDSFRRKSLLEARAAVCDVQLREDLAEAMKEDHGSRWASEPRAAEGARAGAVAGVAGVAGVARAVGPLGTVVQPRAAPPPVLEDPDTYTTSNSDEGTFRPVVRAPAALPLRADMLVRPLPRDTTIPVQNVEPSARLSPEDEPVPLTTAVVIPAALTNARAHPWDTEVGFVPLARDPAPRITADSVSAALEAVESRTNANRVVEHPVEHTERRPERDVDPVKLKVERADRAVENIVPRVDRCLGGEAERDVEKRVEPAQVKEPSAVDKVNVKKPDVNKDLKRRKSDVCERDDTHESGSAGLAERERIDTKSLPKSNRPSDDIQPIVRTRVKKSPTPKSVSNRDINDVSIKEKEVFKEVHEPKPQDKKIKGAIKEVKEYKELKENKASKSRKEAEELEVVVINEVETERHESVTVVRDDALASAFTLTPMKETEEKYDLVEKAVLKTEEQAWDMLLNEPEKPSVLELTPQLVSIDQIIENKPKTKKNRKAKKGPDDTQAKEDEDSFVEIHAIEDKQTPSCGDLVSISTPFEDIDAPSSYLSKIRKTRPSKSITPENEDKYDIQSTEVIPSEDFDSLASRNKSLRKNSSVSAYIEGWPEPGPARKSSASTIEKLGVDFKVKHSECSISEIMSEAKDPPKSKKTKSDSNRKHADKTQESEKKDVYVIDSTKEEFPEIQITKCTKIRKKSPQPVERKNIDKEIVQEKPTKSWSSIAAAKTEKKVEEPLSAIVKYESFGTWEKQGAINFDDYPKSSKGDAISLQDKLIELCKRTDIMVAECDTPSELNFVEEHHADLHDLPPLEPLDFSLDDYKLEVMRDSLLDVNDAKLTSPICKINIDDILSSIKETTSKVIESSTFNLVELEKMPAKREKGFSVVEGHKITTQEVKIDDEAKDDKEGENMEKSSDDDNTSPVVSTDSDKEEKKNIGASNVLLPTAKQSAKCKKSRRKKK